MKGKTYWSATLLFSLCFAITGTNGQELDPLDSAEIMINKLNGIEKVDMLLDVAFNLTGSNPKKSLEYVNQAIYISNTENYDKGLAFSNVVLGVMKLRNGEYDSSLFYFEKGLELRRELDDLLGVASIYNNMAIVRRKKGDLLGSLELQLEAIKIREAKKDSFRLATNYLNIGVLYSNLFHHTLAKEYFSKSIALCELLGNLSTLGFNYSNLGDMYLYQRNFDKAEEYCLKAIEIKEKLNDQDGIATVNETLGEIALLRGKYSMALRYFNKALKIQKEVNSSRVTSLQGIALSQLHLNRLEQAEKNGRQALEMANKSGDQENAQNITYALSLIYAAKKDFDKSNEFRSEFLKNKGLVFREDLKTQIAEMQIRYETEKKEQENKQLLNEKITQEEKLIQQRIIIFISITGILGMLILILFARQKAIKLKNVNKILNANNHAIEEKNHQLQELIDENNTLTNIMVHDLKSPLNNILGFLQLIEKEEEKNDRIDNYLKQIKKITLAGTTIIQDLLLVNKPEYADQELKYACININTMIHSVKADFEKISMDKNIEIKIVEENDVLVNSIENFLQRILYNLISNALKFSPFNSQVVIQIKNPSPEITEIAVSDNGPGIRKEEQNKIFQKFSKASNTPTNGEHSSGLGLAIVKKLTDILEYTIDIESTPGTGTTFLLRIPTSIASSQEAKKFNKVEEHTDF